MWSALPRKADSSRTSRHVRSVPNPEVANRVRCSSAPAIFQIKKSGCHAESTWKSAFSQRHCVALIERRFVSVQALALRPQAEPDLLMPKRPKKPSPNIAEQLNRLLQLGDAIAFQKLLLDIAQSHHSLGSVAEQVGVRRETIWRYRSGTRAPLETLVRIIALIGTKLVVVDDRRPYFPKPGVQVRTGENG